MKELSTLIKKELTEQWRTKRILIMIVVFLFVAVASPIFAKLTPEILKGLSVQGVKIAIPDPTNKDAIDQYIKNISQIALLALVFIVAGAISDEKNKKTLEIVLTKPISRSKFIFSKFFSSYISLSLVYAISSFLFYFYTISIFKSFSFANFMIMNLVILVYVIMIISITILASSILKNSITAGIIGFVCFIIFGTIFGMIDKIKDFSPNLIFSNYMEVINNGYMTELNKPFVVIVILIILSVSLAIWSFNRQEIER